MKKYDLLDAVGGIKPAYIESADKSKKVRKKHTWKALVALAACLCLVVLSIQLLPKVLGGRTGDGSNAGDHLLADGSSEFMSYKGPVLPLSVLKGEDQENLSVHRKILYDFYLLKDKQERDKANLSFVQVKDIYRVENTGSKRTIKFLYPFVSSVDELFFTAPRIIKDGKIIESNLHYGDFAGYFSAAYGSQKADETLNLENINNWLDFQRMLSTTAYLEKAMEVQQDLRQIPVTVYEFKDSYYPEDRQDVENPTLIAGLVFDKEKTNVLSLGFNGFATRDNDQKYYMYSIPKKSETPYIDDHHYLIIVGEDTSSLSIETQSSGGWDAYEEGNEAKRNDLEGAGAKIERLEMSLEEALDLALQHLYELYRQDIQSTISDYRSWQPSSWEESDKSVISYEDFKELYVREILQFGVLSENPIMRYEDGSLESFDTRNAQRIFFAEFELELEASKEINLSIETYKKGSMDFYGKKNSAGVYGYDLLNHVMNALEINSTEAEIKDYGEVEIIRQNFGFDLKNDIRTVQLSDDISHYYMEVMAK